MSDRRAYRRVTGDTRHQMTALRSGGLSDADIARVIGCHRSQVARHLGAAPNPKQVEVHHKPGVPVALGARGQVLTRDTVRTVWNDYALPAGHAATWSCLSSEPFPAGL